MSIKNRITEKNPRTGALPSEQTAENQEQQGAGGSGMLESDKLIYQLVENNVGYAGDQFGDNLRFNSEVLTNVLYDNIYKLLGEKFEEDEFINWLADELVKTGCVTKVQEGEEESGDQTQEKQEEPKEEVVYELDDSAYTELQAKVGAAIELLKANKLTIFKLFSDVDSHLKSLSEAEGKLEEIDDDLMLQRRNEEITNLVDRIQGNQQKLEEHVQISQEVVDEIDEKVEEIQLAMEDQISSINKSVIGNKTLTDGIMSAMEKMGGNYDEYLERAEEDEDKLLGIQVPKVEDLFQPPEKKPEEKEQKKPEPKKEEKKPEKKEKKEEKSEQTEKPKKVEKAKKKITPLKTKKGKSPLSKAKLSGLGNKIIIKSKVLTRTFKKTITQKLKPAETKKQKGSKISPKKTQAIRPVFKKTKVEKSKKLLTQQKAVAKLSEAKKPQKIIQKIKDRFSPVKQGIKNAIQKLKPAPKVNLQKPIEPKVVTKKVPEKVSPPKPVKGKKETPPIEKPKFPKLDLFPKKLPSLKKLEPAPEKKGETPKEEPAKKVVSQVKPSAKSPILKTTPSLKAALGKSLKPKLPMKPPKQVLEKVSPPPLKPLLAPDKKGERKEPLKEVLKTVAKLDVPKPVPEKKAVLEKPPLPKIVPPKTLLKKETPAKVLVPKVTLPKVVPSPKVISPDRVLQTKAELPKAVEKPISVKTGVVPQSEKPVLAKPVKAKPTIPGVKVKPSKKPQTKLQVKPSEKPVKKVSQKVKPLVETGKPKVQVKKIQDLLKSKPQTKQAVGRLKEAVQKEFPKLPQEKAVGSVMKEMKPAQGKAIPPKPVSQKKPSAKTALPKPISPKPVSQKIASGKPLPPVKPLSVKPDSTRQTPVNPIPAKKPVQANVVTAEKKPFVQKTSSTFSALPVLRNPLVKEFAPKPVGSAPPPPPPPIPPKTILAKRFVGQAKQKDAKLEAPKKIPFFGRLFAAKPELAKTPVPVQKPVPVKGGGIITLPRKGKFFPKGLNKPAPGAPPPPPPPPPPNKPPVFPPYNPPGAFPQKPKKRGLFGLFGKKEKPPEIEQPKPTIRERIKWKIITIKENIKNKIANSALGRGVRKVWGGVKKVGRGVRAVWRGAKKVAKFAVGAVVGTAKAAYKTAKVATKAFVAGSKFMGKVALATGKGLWKMMKGIGIGIMEDIQDFAGVKGGKGGGATKGGAAAKPGAKGAKPGQQNKISVKDFFKSRGLIGRIVDFSPGFIITKLGFKALKFGAKLIWKGLKKLAFKALSFFKNLFRLGGKFINKVSNWAVKIGAGIKNVTYKFLVKPLASIMVTTFSFFTGVLMSPIQFMKNVISSLFDRILGTMSNVSLGVKGLLKATWSIFKKILKHPLTIMALIGGLFYLFKDSILEWFSDKIEEVKTNGLLPTLKSLFSGIWDFVCGVGNTIWTIGKFFFDWIESITRPDGWIMTTIQTVINTILWVKKQIKKLLKAAGKDDIDALCMFLSGDLIGIAIFGIAGAVVKMWQWLKKLSFFRIVIGMVKLIVGIITMIQCFGAFVLASLIGALWQMIKGNFGGVVDALVAPWRAWWNMTTDLFQNKPTDNENYQAADMQPEYMQEDPEELNEEKAKETRIAVRSLKMEGAGKGKENAAAIEKLVQGMRKETHGELATGSLIPKIETMNKLYQSNAEQVGNYGEFIGKVWDKGKGNDDLSAQTLKALLESPDLSQKLLSVFFYFHPQTGETMMLRPVAFIGQFLDKIRKMVNDPDRDDQEAFKTLIEAFDQLNKERSLIVNNQGDIIKNVAETVNNANTEEKRVKATEMVQKMNKGDLFDSIRVDTSFIQIANNDAKSQDLKSVTGESFGTNELLKVEPLQSPPRGQKVMIDENGKTNVDRSDFVMQQPPPPPQNKVGQVTFPAAMNPPPLPNPDEKKGQDGKSMIDRWLEHQAKRRELIRNGMDSDVADKKGYRALTYEEFKKEYQNKHPPKEAETAESEDNKASRLAAKRFAADFKAFHNQGSEANVDGFDVTGTPSIIQIPIDGLEQTIYMFSPEWQRVQGASGMSDEQLMLELNAEDHEAQEKIRKAKEEEVRKKKEAAEKKRKEDAILNYTAKVTKDGFIEVKMGEDVVAMEQAYAVHMRKRREFIRNGGTEKAADKMGLKNYTWEEFKRYYRKMHGLPEDGIKRIPIDENMKKKPRNIDWSTRSALSVEELAKYGIQVSEEGPVMIPMEKAMEIANQLLAQAKTIHSIRDGLEVMKQGLETETETLRKRREEGQPFGVIQTGGSGTPNEIMNPTPDTQGYSSFENRF